MNVLFIKFGLYTSVIYHNIPCQAGPFVLAVFVIIHVDLFLSFQWVSIYIFPCATVPCHGCCFCYAILHRFILVAYHVLWWPEQHSHDHQSKCRHLSRQYNANQNYRSVPAPFAELHLTNPLLFLYTGQYYQTCCQFVIFDHNSRCIVFVLGVENQGYPQILFALLTFTRGRSIFHQNRELPWIDQ